MQVNWQVPGVGHPPCKEAFVSHVSYDVLDRPKYDWPKLYPRHSHCVMNHKSSSEIILLAIIVEL